MRKPQIAFVTGGYSSEAVISYKSAITIENNLDKELFDVYRIDITPEEWFHPLKGGGKVKVNREDFSIMLDSRKIEFDAVFIGIHGTPGEDGRLQGYFDLVGLPYASCDAATSAITFNKRYTVAVASFSGIPVAKSLHLFRHEPVPVNEILSAISLPVFVKPNNGGSSIGMSKVNKPSEMKTTLEKAFREDDQVLIEEFISGREFTIGVYKNEGKVITLPFTEIIPENEFFDFAAKYEGKSREVTPAECPESMAENVRNTAEKVYRIFNCRGIVRIDFIYNEEAGAAFLLEINTIPGQTEASLVPQQVRILGISLKDFYTSQINEALAQKKEKILV